jgi:hypothetical protein
MSHRLALLNLALIALALALISCGKLATVAEPPPITATATPPPAAPAVQLGDAPRLPESKEAK